MAPAPVHPLPAPPPGRRRGAVLWAGAAVLGAVMLAGTASYAASTGSTYLKARLAGLPTPPADARPTRILPAVVAPDAPGRYAYMRVRPDGSPVTYDPCRPIHVVINPAGAPPGGEQSVHNALARLSAATGLSFVVDGHSAHVPLTGRPVRDDDGWAPVLLGWGTEGTDPDLAGPVAGLGGSIAVQVDGPGTERYVTGEVLLDADVMRGFGTARGHRDMESVAVHELAHVLGLDHVPADSELMSPTYIGIRDLGPGDRAGLARLGQGSCHTDT